MREKAIQASAEPQFLQGVSAVVGGEQILCSGKRLSGHRVQPSGLRPLPAFPGVELSHSPVNMTQWLTASTFRCHIDREANTVQSSSTSSRCAWTMFSQGDHTHRLDVLLL